MSKAPPKAGDDATITYLIRDLPADIWRQAKSRAALEGKTMKALIAELLKDYAKGKPRR